MCLSKIEHTYVRPSGLIVDGWKQFSGTKSAPEFSVMKGAGAVKLDEWMQASGPQIRSDYGEDYAAGFHVYADEPKQPQGYRRVYVRGVTCSGRQSNDTRCLIAQELYVPSDPNAWPPKAAPATPPPPPAPKKKLMNRIRKAGGAS
jgi:hypothetical protein